MTDVVRIAKERVAALEAEIGKLNDFIRMAEALLKQSLPKSNKAPATEDEKPAESTGLRLALLIPATAGGSNADGAEPEREDVPVLELTAKELVRKPRAVHNEPPPDQRFQRWSHKIRQAVICAESAMRP